MLILVRLIFGEIYCNVGVFSLLSGEIDVIIKYDLNKWNRYEFMEYNVDLFNCNLDFVKFYVMLSYCVVLFCLS